MKRMVVDVLVIGAGFAGSLCALILSKLGYEVLVVDRGQHPRFAIGESSTPLADLMLGTLAERYGLSRLRPLTHYGTWIAAYPEVLRGPKRGFSYFFHEAGKPFATDERHSRELLVSASSSLDVSDTHWFRADVDQFFAREVSAAGIPLWEETQLECVGRSPWVWAGTRSGEACEIVATTTIDASGPTGLVARAAGMTLDTERFHTWSRSVYAHVSGLRTWESILRDTGVAITDYPFPCDHAALHQVLDEGWMWQLRFDHGVTSVGILLDQPGTGLPPAVEWASCLQRYPSLVEQFRETRLVAPFEDWRGTGRLQRRWSSAAGDDWALLPSAAGFIDPLHSSGIAHTLAGIERLVHAFDPGCSVSARRERLAEHATCVQHEMELIDTLVATAYATRRVPALFHAATMLYFALATTCEQRRLEGCRTAFLCADDPLARSAILNAARDLRALAGSLGATPDGAVVAAAVEQVRQVIQPWNSASLLNPQCGNMYWKTALPAKSPAF